MRKRKHEFRRFRRHVLVFLFILLLGLLNNHLKAQQTTWTGAIDSDWNNPDNWSSSKIPGASDNVSIGSPVPFHPVISSDAACRMITLEKGAYLTLSGSTKLSVNGNFNNSGKFDGGTGTVKFSGSALQSVTSLSPLSFYNLEIDNTGKGVSFGCSMNVLNELILKNGNLITEDTVWVLNDDEDALKIYSEKSHVAGKLTRKINPASGEKYFFPVGLGEVKKYFPARIDVHSLHGTRFITVSFSALERCIQSYVDTRDPEMNYDYLAPEGMWTITPDAEPDGGWYDLHLWLSNMSGLQDNLFAILKRPAGAGPRDWTAAFGEKSAFGGEGRKLADGYALKKYCTSFSELAIGGTGEGIPVELLHFDARLDNSAVHLSWSTATETDNAFFVVEKSNGTDFREVATITAGGNSSVQKNYSAVDEKPFTGVSYYRLKQTDFSGSSEYSDIVSVNNEGAESQMVFFPNPSEGTFRIHFLSPVQNVDAVVYNQHGAICFSKSFGGSRLIEMNLKEELPSGIYYMQISTSSGDISIQKCVIE